MSKPFECTDVLEVLSDFVDGEVSDEIRLLVGDHLAGCNRCERFGGAFGEMLAAVRKQLGVPEPVDAGIQERLRAVLSKS